MRLSGAAVALAVALSGVAFVAWLGSASRAPSPGRETTYWLAVESLAVDGDALVRDVDRDRFEARFGARPVGVQVVPEGEAKRLDAPWLWSRAAALARASVGASGVALLQIALFVWTAVVATATLRSRVGSSGASRLVLTTLFASAAFAVPFRLEPRALEMAAMATAGAAVWYRRSGPGRAADDVYRGDLASAPSAWRWLVAGACAALVVGASPTYLPLIVPLVAAAPAARRGRAIAAFTVAFAAMAATLLVASGPPWEALDIVPSPSLLAWSTLGIGLGRGVGLAPYFLPLLLLPSLGGRDDGKRFVLAAALVAIVLQVVVAPFDFVEGALAPGNAWFLPLLALGLLSVEGGESPGATWTTALLGLPLLAAPWLQALGAERTAEAVARRVAVVERWLPAASTLRLQPGAFDLDRSGLRVRAFAPGFGRSADGGLRWRAAQSEMFVVADRPLSSIRLELGSAAPAEIDVRGGKLGNVTLRPNGDVAVDVAVDPKRARRHPVWWSRADAWTYPISLRLAKAPTEDLPLDVPFGRLAVPTGEGR